MPTETRQKNRYCKTCRRRTLHVSTVTKTDLGCGFIAANLLLSVVTLGLWVPIFILAMGVGTLGNAVATAPYYCQQCGEKN